MDGVIEGQALHNRAGDRADSTLMIVDTFHRESARR
jgi:hypothetical protein